MSDDMRVVAYTSPTDLDRVKKGKSGDIYGERKWEGSDVEVFTIPLVLQSEAQAQIAARDAEILRLREALDALENANNNLCFMRSKNTYQSMLRDGCEDLLEALDRARLGAREALKGGAA